MNQDYTLVLKGGTVVDGSGGPAVPADIACRGAEIVAIDPGRAARGALELDCAGLVVAPGFIDTHSHSDLRVLVEPDLPMKVRQGVTHEVLGQDGISVAPLREEHTHHVRRSLAGLDGDPPVEWRWRSVADYLGALDAARPAPNLSYLVPHGQVRGTVMGYDARRATEAELVEMGRLLDRSLSEGAVGLSTGLIYPPCVYADTAELEALCRVVARHDAVFVAHVRNESDFIRRAIDEMIAIGRATGCRCHISHFKIAGRRNWGEVDGLLAVCEEARAQGLRLTADQYPYGAGSTMMGAILPPWAHAGGTDRVVERLSDPATRARLRAEILSDERSEWDNFWHWSGPEGILIADVPSGRRPEVVGKSVAQAAREAGGEARDPLEFALDLLRDERMGVAMVSFSQSEDVVERMLLLPWANVCTDGLLGGRPHPRAYGTYPRILGRYVRERRLLPLEQAVRKMTALAAESLGLGAIGRIAPGFQADLVAFDPATVADTATFEDPIRYPIGIRHVVVRGEPVVRDERPTGARPGRVFRRTMAR